MRGNLFLDVSSQFCCGLYEVNGLQESKSGKQFIEAVAREANGLPAYIAFTAIARYTKKGQAVVDYIENNKLGSVIRVAKRPIVNGNSGNKVHMWVWIPNKRKFQSIAREAQEKFNKTNGWNEEYITW